MARLGASGPSDPGPIAPGPRDFPLTKIEDPGTGSSYVEGDSQATAEAEVYRRVLSLDFGPLRVEAYGGAPGAIVAIPDVFFGPDCNLDEDDDWRQDFTARIAFKWTLIYELLQETGASHPHLVP